MCLPDNSILTPSARDFAVKSGLTVTRGDVVIISPAVHKNIFQRPSREKEKTSPGTQEYGPETPAAGIDESTILEVVQKVMVDMNRPICENPQVAHIAGDNVVIEPFEKAPAGQDVRMTNVVTAREGNLAAGFMILERSAFPWTLSYDEIDYVVEGEFELEVGNKVYNGKPGDVISIPKGASVVFASPSHAKVFYVTYPANWEKSAPDSSQTISR